MSLFIRDEKVRALATELAARRNCTLTDAVREALEDSLRQIGEAKAEKLRRTRELIASVKKLPDLRPGLTDKDLYDAEGNPVL